MWPGFMAAYTTAAASRRGRPTVRRVWPRALVDLAIVCLAGLIVGMVLRGGGQVDVFGIRVSFTRLYTPVLMLTLMIGRARVDGGVRPPAASRARCRSWRTRRRRRSAALVCVGDSVAGAVGDGVELRPARAGSARRSGGGTARPASTCWRTSRRIRCNPLFGVAVVRLAVGAAGGIQRERRVGAVGGARDDRRRGALGRVPAASRAGSSLPACSRWLALGPFITVAQQLTYIPTPWALLRYLPIIGAARTPTRMTIVVMLGVVDAAGHGGAASAQPLAPSAPAGGWRSARCCCSSCCPRRGRCTRPRSRRSIGWSPPIRGRSASCRCRSGCATASARAANYSSSSQFYQTFHEKRLVGGYISRLPGGSVERYRRNMTLSVLLRLSEGAPVEPSCTEDALQQAERNLRRLQIGYVVIDPQPMRPASSSRLRIGCSRSTLVTSDGVTWSSIARRSPLNSSPRRASDPARRPSTSPDLSRQRESRCQPRATMSACMAISRRGRRRSAGITRSISAAGSSPKASMTARCVWRGWIFRASLAGLTVLDIGAWDGFFSFEAERRGAARVVAADYFSWHGDRLGLEGGIRAGATQRSARRSRMSTSTSWISRPNASASSTSCSSSASSITCAIRSWPSSASPRSRASCLILETVVDMVGIGRPAMAFYRGRELNNDPTNWWAPNVPALHAMLRDVGFTDVRRSRREPGPRSIAPPAPCRIDCGARTHSPRRIDRIGPWWRREERQSAVTDDRRLSTIPIFIPLHSSHPPVHTSPQIDNRQPKRRS